jgi:hypothetical protein
MIIHYAAAMTVGPRKGGKKKFVGSRAPKITKPRKKSCAGRVRLPM